MKLPTNPHIEYTSPQGKQFRLMVLEKIPNTEKWINRVEKSKWKAIIKMIETNELMELECDYDDNVIKINNTINKYR